MATRTVDELIVLAVQTNTSLRVFDGELRVLAGPCLHPDTEEELRAAGPQLVQRLRDLFGAEDTVTDSGDHAPEDGPSEEDSECEFDIEDDEPERFPNLLTEEEAEAIRQRELRAMEEFRASGRVPQLPRVFRPGALGGPARASASDGSGTDTAGSTGERSASRSLSEPPLALDASSSTVPLPTASSSTAGPSPEDSL